MKEVNIVLAGVGGQGTLLAAEILGVAAVKDGLNVRVSEIHGMAQRGGAVTSNVKIGERVYSPTILDGQADVLLGFEPLETLRNLKYVSDKTLVIVSDEKIAPAELAAKNLPYPSDQEIVEKINRFTKNVVFVATEKLAKQAGSTLTRNTVLLGALIATRKSPLKLESVAEAIRELVPSKFVDVNLCALNLGLNHAEQKS